MLSKPPPPPAQGPSVTLPGGIWETLDPRAVDPAPVKQVRAGGLCSRCRVWQESLGTIRIPLTLIVSVGS